MRRLWAVARTTLREAVRTRTVAVVLVAIVVVVGLSLLTLRGSGTLGDRVKLVDRVQLVLSYSLTAIGFLLSMLTIFLSASTLATDLRERRIETVATKPIRRWQILVGKWMAVMVLNVVLLVVAGGASYVLVRHVIGRPSAAKDEKERARLDREVYTARHTVEPTRPTEQIEAYITREIQEKRSKGQLDKDFDENAYRRKRRKDVWNGYNTLRPGYPCEHMFEHVMPASPDEQLFIRYKVVAIGSTGQGAGENSIWLQWVVSPDPVLPGPHAIVFPPEKVSLGDYHELAVPASVVSAKNEVYVACGNLTHLPGIVPADVYAAFPAEEGVQLLYKAGTFKGNFVRTMLLVLARLAFLSALALAAAALLTFPVASLLVLFVFMCALSVDNFMALALPIAGTEDAPVYESPAVYRPLLRALAAVVPNFGRYDGARALATGRLVPWRLVVRGLVVVAAIYGGVVMALGCLYFRGRELADTE